METNESILTREIVAIDDRKKLGKMKELRVDCDTLAVSHLIISSASTNTAMVLPFEKSLAIGDTFLTIQSRDDFLATSDSVSKAVLSEGFRLTGVDVFSKTGNRLGVVKSYEFDPITGKVTSIKLGDSSFAADTFVFFADEFVFVDDGAPTAPELRGQGGAAVDSASSDSADTREPVTEPANATDESDEDASEKAGSAAADADESRDEDEKLKSFLIGSTVTYDVASKDGGYTVKKGTKLTAETVEEAQKHDLLLQLTMSVDA